ncbi:hypothetical protein BS78_03G041900 [Paspalum vaginatum]|nr:hypothetical protein BS78_03G041900 [Paspalum vaginatum]
MASTTAAALLLLALLLHLAGQRAGAASGAGEAAGFSLDFIHRDSHRSPFRDPAPLSPHARTLAAARRSLVRGDVLAAPAPSGGGVESKIISRSFEYLMYVYVGTPPTQMLAIADTGSDLVWVDCSNGSDSGEGRARGAGAGGVVFQPSNSSTYDLVGCQDAACGALSQASCDAASECQYQYSYGDGSRTIGVLSTETFSFVAGGSGGGGGGGGGEPQVSVPHVNFGCSTYMAGTFRSDGLVGLGGGALSLVSQLGTVTQFGRRFSYCLIPSYAANASSTLNFGARAVVSEPGAATTPLVPSDVDAYYTVELVSVAIAGGQTVASNATRIIVDSGTTLTFLDPALLQPLVAELERRITLPRAQSPEKLLELCYDVSGGRPSQQEWGIPDVTLRFGGGGGAVTLRPENTFALVQEGTLCLLVVPVTEAQPVSILGNIAQQNFHVGYDLDARTVTFAAADCTRSSASS